MTHVESKEQVLFRLHATLLRVLQSQYFLYALMVHLAILAILGGRVVLKSVRPPEPPAPVDRLWPVSSPPSIPPPRHELNRQPSPDQPTRSELERAEAQPSERPTGISVLAVNNAIAQSHSFTIGAMLSPPTAAPPSGSGVRRNLIERERERLARIWDYQRDWVDWKNWHGDGPPPATFTCYLGKYADGDWNCNPTALGNMLVQVVRWSRERVHASVQPVALDLAGDEIYKTHPPFIFLTGHKDFHLTDAEVTNLREYLMSGGAIWADNSLPGRHSRFDEAFRREMKRVFPDRDFVPVPAEHEIFHAMHRFKEVPSGMNSYHEPIEQITIGDELAVIYTQNDYSDLWETALDDQNKIDTETYYDEDTGGYYHKWGPHWGNYQTAFLYRNVNDASIVEADQLGFNIVVHLLTRYENKFRMLGKL